MAIEFRIPTDAWELFRNRILSRPFKSNDPRLTRHRQERDKSHEYGRFSSDCREDIDFVVSILPPNAEYFNA